jgi:hypothetical protein
MSIKAGIEKRIYSTKPIKPVSKWGDGLDE